MEIHSKLHSKSGHTLISKFLIILGITCDDSSLILGENEKIETGSYPSIQEYKTIISIMCIQGYEWTSNEVRMYRECGDDSIWTPINYTCNRIDNI